MSSLPMLHRQLFLIDLGIPKPLGYKSRLEEHASNREECKNVLKERISNGEECVSNGEECKNVLKERISNGEECKNVLKERMSNGEECVSNG